MSVEEVDGVIPVDFVRKQVRKADDYWKGLGKQYLQRVADPESPESTMSPEEWLVNHNRRHGGDYSEDTPVHPYSDACTPDDKMMNVADLLTTMEKYVGSYPQPMVDLKSWQGSSGYRS